MVKVKVVLLSLRPLLVLLIGLLIVGCSSCYTVPISNKTSVNEYKLNNRQKEILKQEGLPTNYNDLSISQKASIEAIDTLFDYLQKKYPDEKFTYNGYVGPTINPLEEEHLIVNSNYGLVNVYREYNQQKTVITDDFAEVKVAYKYASTLNDYIKSFVDENLFVVDVDINEFNKDSAGTTPSSYGANIKIYFNEKIGKKVYVKNIKKILSYYSKKAKCITDVEFALIKENEFSTYVVQLYENDDSFSLSDFIKCDNYKNNGQKLNVFIKY